MTFKALMIITVKFDLKTVQMNMINTFVNSKLNEVIYMKQPPRFKKNKGTVLWLRKTLYELRRSSLLWQKELISTLCSLKFMKISQKSCVMINRDIITFFYMNDIVICYRKKDEGKVKSAICDLQSKYELSRLEKFKWFLEIHILRDRAKNFLWLSQEVYINKIANQFNVNLIKRLSNTLIISKLLSNKTTALKSSIHNFQRKTDFILFTIIIT
jgi:hypothetical protein